MAGVLSTDYMNGLIDLLFRGREISNTSLGYLPSTLYLALLTSAPQEDPTYLYLYIGAGQEASYTGYQRVGISRNLTSWLSTQNNSSVSSGASGATSNSSTLYFPICTTSSQVITHVGLCEEQTGYDGALVAYFTLDRPIQLSNASPGFYPTVPAGGLKFSIDS